VPDAARRVNRSHSFGADSEFLEKLSSKAFEELRRLHKISCWHMNDSESAAMWRLYLRENRGIAIASTIRRLRNSLKPYRIKPEYGEEEAVLGVVRYVDYKTTELEGGSFLGPFFHKRRSYAYEQELRVIISVRMAEEFGVTVPEKGILVEVNLAELIDAVYIAPGLDSTYKQRVAAILHKILPQCPIHQSELDDQALY